MVSEQFTKKCIQSEEKNINLYTSTLTGLSCVHVELDLPTVSGYFTLATECHDDSGSPHTLEHLIFLGSERYPYKGVLDSLANRAFAQGTNAWTDTDHTAYTIETVGEDGFLRLLPIFVDHILYPTLTESGCYTEVHHINGIGEDAGVVYSEMQGVENTGPSLMSLRAQRLLHDTKSGYKSETGGLLKEIRKLTVDEIKAYHGKYYVPHNLVLIITGKIESKHLLDTLRNVDRNILSHGSNAGTTWRRPWTDSNPRFALKTSLIEVVQFPEEDESMGEITFNWPGPSCTEHLDICALDILGQYLTHTAIAPLQAALVELEDPLCTDIEFYVSDRLRSTISVSLSSVPTELIEAAQEAFWRVLEKAGTSTIDLKRISALVEKDKLKVKNAVESDPHGAFSTPIITDYLYGSRNGESLKESLDDLKYLDLVKAWSSQRWQDYIAKWLLHVPCATIVGKPSAALAKSIQAAEEARVQAQVNALGPTGLQDLATRLEQAQASNDRVIPESMIASFSVPDVSLINFIRPRTACVGFASKDDHLQKVIDSDTCRLPLHIQFDNVTSSFVSISIYISTSAVDKELRPYLSVYLHSLFLNPIDRNGEEISYEQVIEELELDTISYSACFGAGGGFNELIRVKVKTERAKYSKGIEWLDTLLNHAIFDPERIGVAISKIQNDLPSCKRDGDTVATSVLGVLQLDSTTSTARVANLLDQTKFLEKLEQDLDDDEDAVMERFELLADQLMQFEHMRIHVTSDIALLTSPVSAWRSFGNCKSSQLPVLSPLILSRDVLTDYARTPSGDCRIITIATDSCFAQHFSQCIADFASPDLPALYVMISYLNAMEGLLWKYIRGAGLAYGADLKLDLEAGLLYFSIYRAPDAFAAWNKAREIMQELVNGTIEISQLMVEGAKSSIVYDFVSRESTPYAAAHQSFVNQVLKGQSSEYRRELLQKIANVTLDEMREVLKKYLIHLFIPSSSNCVVVGGTSKATQLLNDFEKHGFRVKLESLEEFEASMD